ncbi:MAG: hypothetical protein FWF03_02050 [Defluviitaleaceae bacterium]|nr:hypothetical protein [Defluviitaleaceae bacterium]
MGQGKLQSGGLIVNYRCPAACGHCMYGSGNGAAPGYMTYQDATRICASLKALGCGGLHIGGGEPFLNVTGLAAAVDAIIESGISLDYVETNAAWITLDNKRDLKTLNEAFGGKKPAVMVSVDPFHIEFIPLNKPLALIGLLRENGFPYFIWQERYVNVLSKLDWTRTYGRGELMKIFGCDIVGSCAKEYGLGYNGRALNLLRLDPNNSRGRAGKYIRKEPCPNLKRPGHFHADYFGRYIPPGCTGIGVLLEDFNGPLDAKRYPTLTRLLAGGTALLYEYALGLGFADGGDFVSECDVCFKVKQFLNKTDGAGHPDLHPAEFYSQDY